MDSLRARVDIVQSFDRLADDLVAELKYMAANAVVEDATRPVHYKRLKEAAY